MLYLPTVSQYQWAEKITAACLSEGEGKGWLRPQKSLAGMSEEGLLYRASSWRLNRCLLCLKHRHHHRESRKMKNQAKVFQTKEWGKFLEANYNAMELCDLFNRELKTTLIKMATTINRTMHKQSENFNKKIDNTKNFQNRNHGA